MKEARSVFVLIVFLRLRFASLATVATRSLATQNCEVVADWLKCSGSNLPRETSNFTSVEWNVQNRSSISRQDLRYYDNVIELRITGSELTSIEYGTFESMTNLINLAITGTNISKISTLRGLDSLQNLDFSGNKFQKLDDVMPALIELPSLRRLSLASNEITSVTKETVEIMASLHEVDLTGNPLWCDCGLKAMRPYIFDYRTPTREMLFIKTGYCRGPNDGELVAEFMTRIYKMHCSEISDFMFTVYFVLGVGLVAGGLAIVKESAKRVEARLKTVKKPGQRDKCSEKQKLPGNGLQADSPLLKENAI